eukprot:4181018-Pyramimonas_sp.AAC.1
MAAVMCEGIRQQIELDSAIALATGDMEKSYPAGGEDGVEAPPAKKARRGPKLLGGVGGLRRR